MQIANYCFEADFEAILERSRQMKEDTCALLVAVLRVGISLITWPLSKKIGATFYHN